MPENEQNKFEALRTELQNAFAEPEAEYIEITASDIYQQAGERKSEQSNQISPPA